MVINIDKNVLLIFDSLNKINMNQKFYFSSHRKRGYYPPGPSYGNHGYGYGNPPVIMAKPFFYIDSSSESLSESEDESFDSEIESSSIIVYDFNSDTDSDSD